MDRGGDKKCGEGSHFYFSLWASYGGSTATSEEVFAMMFNVGTGYSWCLQYSEEVFAAPAGKRGVGWKRGGGFGGG